MTSRAASKRASAKLQVLQLRSGSIFRYYGKNSTLSRNGYTVRIIAEARRGRVVVEAVGHKGMPVRFTVKATSLDMQQPDLFDGI